MPCNQYTWDASAIALVLSALSRLHLKVATHVSRPFSPCPSCLPHSTIAQDRLTVYDQTPG